MPRPKKLDRDLPSCVYRNHGAFYLVKNNKWIRLGDDLATALKEYAKRQNTPTDGMPGLLARWFDDVEIAATTRKHYGTLVRQLSKVFAEFEPWEVTARDILTYMHSLRKKPGMANHGRNVLIGALDFAFLEGTVERNVARDVRPLPTKARDRYLTTQEFDAIHAQATDTLKVVMKLCYFTGQRISDVLAIRYADLTPEGIVFRQHKTKHRMIVSWSPELREVVDQAKALHSSLKGMTLRHTRKGTPFSYFTIRTLWDRAVKASGVEDARIHDLRAKAATDTDSAGRDSKGLLGHKSESSHMRYLRSKQTPVAEPATFKKAV